ncbi:MAG: class A beta-lactamase-related serine hydrolase [Bifidobacterium sp.]|nr:class A beta-lactamase-related serine hydrolase [Bifidobacterium sp.]
MVDIFLDSRVRWSVEIRDGSNGSVLYAHTPANEMETASIGKLFLLMYLMHEVDSGRIDIHEVIDRRVMSPDDFCEDSGLLYLLEQQTLSIKDLGFFVGAFSDNYATNLLVERVGLKKIQEYAREQGFRHSNLLDFVRMKRTAENPADMSCGCGSELCDYMMKLQSGQLVSHGVSRQIERWLGTDTDTSMVASAFNVDPLAHWQEKEAFRLRHKTGTESDVRCDVGFVRCLPTGKTVAYAVLANWDKTQHGDLRDVVLSDMRKLGALIRDYVEGGENVRP